MQQFLIKFQKSQFFYEGLPRVHPPPLKARGGGGVDVVRSHPKLRRHLEGLISSPLPEQRP